MKGLVGGVATASAEARRQWTTDLIPQSEVGEPCTSPQDKASAYECAWGGGDVATARRDMREAEKRHNEMPGIPWTRLAPLSAAGPSGDRQEHLDDVLSHAGASKKR
eukprot:6172903-Karenia_brevis.AAC.1